MTKDKRDKSNKTTNEQTGRFEFLKFSFDFRQLSSRIRMALDFCFYTRSKDIQLVAPFNDSGRRWAVTKVIVAKVRKAPTLWPPELGKQPWIISTGLVQKIEDCNSPIGLDWFTHNLLLLVHLHRKINRVFCVV